MAESKIRTFISIFAEEIKGINTLSFSETTHRAE